MAHCKSMSPQKIDKCLPRLHAKKGVLGSDPGVAISLTSSASSFYNTMLSIEIIIYLKLKASWLGCSMGRTTYSKLSHK